MSTELVSFSHLPEASAWAFSDMSDPHTARLRVEFPNGFELSVIRGEYSYGGDAGLFEVAVIDPAGSFTRAAFTEDPGDDVLGWQTPADVEALALRVAALSE